MSTRADDLRKAFDSYEDEEEQEAGGPPEDSEEPVGDPEAPGEEEEVEETEEGSEEDDESEEEDSEGAALEEDERPGAPKGTPAKVQKGRAESLPGQPESKPPVSWRASAREQWTKLPPEVQREVSRREREIENFHNQTKHERQLAAQFNETIRPFEPLIASQNSTPLQAVRNLMTTAAGLTLGSPQQKAQIIGNIIQQYGVDIGVLDDVLSGQASPENQQSNQISQILQQHLAPIQGFMQEVRTARQTYEQRQTQTTQEAIQKFADTHDFFEDVRQDMADIMEMAAKRGQEMDMEEAYKRAVALNPEISQILARRQNMNSAQNRASVASRKRRAASSVRGAPSGRKSAGSADSRRGAIEAAWEEASGTE